MPVQAQTALAAPALAGAPPKVPAAQQLTLAQALEYARNNSPLLQGALYQVASARANLSGQRAPVNPIFNVGGLNNSTGPSVGPLDLGRASNYAFAFTVETNGGIGWRTSQARNQLFGTQADARTTSLGVAQAVTGGYIDLQVADANLENEQQAYASALRISDLTEKQFRLGAAPETSASRAAIALTQEQSSLLKANSVVRVARASLNIQMGRDAEVPVDAADALEYRPAADLPTLNALQTRAVQNRPELQSAEFARRALRANVGLQRAQSLPNLYVGTDLEAIQSGRLQFGLTLPLFDFGSIRGAVRKAQSDVKAQEAVLTQQRQIVQLDVSTAYDALRRSQRIVALYQEGILPTTASLLQKIEKGYTLGGSTILDLIDAQNNNRQVRSDYNNAIGDYNRALAQLERAIGEPLTPASATSLLFAPAVSTPASMPTQQLKR